MSTATYIGETMAVDHGTLGGLFYNGIPARDLTAEEYAALSAEQQALVQSGVLYVYVP